MAARPDMSDMVIHFTKADENHTALERLLVMVGEGRLIGGTGMIKGVYRCVCFTEAPIPAMTNGFVNANSFTRYSPFGLMFDKKWVYEKGARPVIYQPDADFENLPENMRWRHVRYEPPQIDFTWEREWRLHADELEFSPQDVVLVVPDQEHENFVFDIWDAQQQLEAEMYSTVLDAGALELMHQPCPWRIVKLAQ